LEHQACVLCLRSRRLVIVAGDENLALAVLGGLGAAWSSAVARDGGDARDDQEERSREEAEPHDPADRVDCAVVMLPDGCGDGEQ
jgi:hypothetical protein